MTVIYTGLKEYTVFFCAMNDEQVADLNAKGWDASAAGSVYADIAVMPKNVPEKTFHRAIDLGLYTPAAKLEAATMDNVFLHLQNDVRPWKEVIGIQCLTKFPRSMSVGDILVDHDTDTWLLTVGVGFEQITSVTVIDRLKGML